MKETIMAEKFDPAPHDKYAVGVKEAARADRKTSEELKTGLKDSFPASDPVSATQPTGRNTITTTAHRSGTRSRASSNPDGARCCNN
jgi:hypothetical protein